MARAGGGFFSNVAAQVVGGVLLALAVAWLGYLGLVEPSADAANSGTGVAQTGPAPAQPKACPERASDDAGHKLFQVRVFETDKSRAYICRDAQAMLWYHGLRKSDGATITLRAYQDDNGYRATDQSPNGTTVYRVNNSRLTKTTGDTVELDQAVTSVD